MDGWKPSQPTDHGGQAGPQKCKPKKTRSRKRRGVPRHGMVGDSPAFRELLRLLRQLKKTELNLLLQGPSGSGKDLAARYIHEDGLRADGPFVEVSCGNLPTTLAESELFGHKRGAFTGATSDRKGAFEMADGGTLLLNEIGDMDREIQVKILRAIQFGIIQRLGETKDIHVDVRVIAATWKDLSAMVAEGEFREDLYYRLTVGQVELPPLKNRGNDMVLIARHLLKTAPRKHHLPRRSLSHAGVVALRAHHWPGNVRELEHVLYRALATGSGRSLSAEDIEQAIQQTSGEQKRGEARGWRRRPLQEILEENSPMKAADLRAALGVSKSTMHRMIEPLLESGKVFREGRGVATQYLWRGAVELRVVPDPRWDAVMALAQREGRVTRGRVAEEIGVSGRTATRILKAMTLGGLLGREGTGGRGTGYMVR